MNSQTLPPGVAGRPGRIHLVLRSLVVRPAVPRPGFAVPFWAVAVAIVLSAAALRLAWVNDIEYKADEQAFYEIVRSVRGGAPWPAFGLPSSQKIPTHGMMVWVFLLLDAVVPSDSPTDLARLCQGLNVLAVAGLVVFARECVRPPARAVWLWGAAVAAVNPVAVVMQRKIWNVSITPAVLLAVLVGYWHRDRRWGAFLWGSAVMVVGMMHAGGLFLAAGLAGWAALHDRRRVRWGWWAAGSAATGWLLVPWALAILGGSPVASSGRIKWTNPLTLSFFTRWLTEPFGFGLPHSLGHDFADFLRHPLIEGTPTYLMAAAHAALGAVAVHVLARAWRNRGRTTLTPTADEARTRHFIGAVLVAFGAIFTLTWLPICRHYMILTFPAMYVWLAALALADRRPFGRWTRGQAALAVSVAVQLAVSVGFLSYIHDAHRTIRGDYGTPYSAQLLYGLPPK